MPSQSDRRYVIVAGALLVQSVIIGCMFAYGVFFKELEAEMGWSRTLLSGASSLAFLVMGMLAMLAGRLNDRFGPRWVLTFSGLATGVGYALMMYISAPWQLYVLFGVLIGFGLSTHDVVTLSVVARHFEKRRGMMTGVVKVGTACGQMMVPFLATLLIAAIGWREAFLVIGIVAGILLLVAAQMVAVTPIQRKTGADNVAQRPRLGLSFPQARRTRQFWTLCAVQFCFFPSLMSIPVHIFVHATDLGIDGSLAALVVSAIAFCSIGGRLSVGGSIDRIGARRALVICFVPLVLCLLLLTTVETATWLFVFAAVYGFAHGGLFTVVSPTIAEYFGMRAHGAVFGAVLFFGTLGGALGPIMCGRIYDQTGSYTVAFLILAGLAMLGLLLVLSLRPLDQRALSTANNS